MRRTNQRTGPKTKKTGTRAGRVALYGMMTALAFLFGYVESLIPIHLGAPGIKLGLANLAAIVSLYLLGTRAAAGISLVRVVLTGFTFANLSMMLYGLAGASLSLLVMGFLKKTERFGCVGVSAAGGAAHNIGQLLVACMVLESANLLYYLPVLLAAGTAAGCVIGCLGGIVAERLSRAYGAA
ncbi:MAG: Gx transporter family protein [Clostridium sp.]|nr:Gx transporter family protein [Clostridium sp.]